MAEFCLECWSKLCGKEFTQKDYVLSKEPDLCEECGQWKPVVERERRFPALYTLCISLREKFTKK